MTAGVRLNWSRLRARLDALGRVGALEGGGVCRLALTPEDKAGRDLVAGWMRELGLHVSIDAIGNIIGVRSGLEDGPPVMTGSHIDTVRTGGLYDGTLGVLAGLEVVAALNDAGVTTRRPLAVGVFTNEEGARFAPDMMGSLVYVGGLALAEALATEGMDGQTVGDALAATGYAGPAPVAAPAVHAFVELHIEQGPVLEEQAIAIGAVEGVQGISWTEVTVEGTSNHAGTTPMRLRRDAGYVATATAAFMRDLARRMGGDQVATVGSLALTPNLINVVPGRARFTLDLRNTDEGLLQETERAAFAEIDRLAAAESCSVTRRSLARFEPVAFDPAMVDRVEAAARARGLSVRRMPSGAGHDAQMMARVCPTGMIFVPSAGGISHNVTEHTDDVHLQAGAAVLLDLLVDLAMPVAQDRP
ncbi:M20 family metallo-hydrolase [Roseospira visakhapatnamensis]|uniref:N-carbamoyl-L-amino-acid hydrolase n=1 Tax=Roseospira visakhapatnamensis TaxID=390880 RepID=A0A7W6RH32_9PROT|nr:M20 family metallo-hydrolase [Roseospira visakhapatnamensis]MBB4267748.1 N-carbamoyl-L-amino-acid hydrolase [Roseospira visakhapatnamensis]